MGSRSNFGSKLLPCLEKFLQTIIDMNADEARDVLWPSPQRAMCTLIWVGLLLFPASCPKCGHDEHWNISGGDNVYAHMHCRRRVPREDVDDEDSEADSSPRDRMRMCNKRMTWRQNGSFQKDLPNTMKPINLLKGLYWFLEGTTTKTGRKQSQLTEKQWSLLSWKIRKTMFEDLNEGGGEKLGGRGVAVCVDETFFTKKKKVRGGFTGRLTAGNKTIVLGMVEINLRTRTETGRMRLLVIPNRNKATLKRAIEEHVEEGSLIFTDKFNAYSFLSRANSNFVHRAINHRAREFSRVEEIFGEAITVTTNAAEGLFGRVKSFLRQRQIRRVSGNAYGVLLAEYMWRRKELGMSSEWRDAGLWALLDLLVRRQVVERPANLLEVSDELADQLQQFKEGTRVIPAAPAPAVPPPSVAPIAAAAAAADAGPPSRRRLILLSSAEIRRRLQNPRRPPATVFDFGAGPSAPAVSAPWSQASSLPLPPDPAGVEFSMPSPVIPSPTSPMEATPVAEEPEAEEKVKVETVMSKKEEDADSDVEVVSMKIKKESTQAHKRFRAVKMETTSRSMTSPMPAPAVSPVIPAPTATSSGGSSSSAGGVRAQRGLFCNQGHALRHYRCDPEWQPMKKRKTTVWAMTHSCDICDRKALDIAWSCDRCSYDVCEDCAANLRR